MSFYQSKGLIPSKRHTIFKKDADSIYYEELISRKGFSGIYSNVYHLRMPTKINKMGFIQGPLDLINAFTQKPFAIIVGFGPGRFGSQYALTEGYTGRSPLADPIYRSYYFKSNTVCFFTAPNCIYS